MGCDRSFHFPCAAEGQCVTQFFGQHRCFCLEHLPQQPLETAPTQDTTCIICMEPVGLSRSYCTMVCPACQHAWFHRACIQGMAKSAGLCCFQCPLCRDREVFIQEMVNLGIHIPARLVSFSQLSRHEGTRAQVPAQGLSRQAWPFAAWEQRPQLHTYGGTAVRLEEQGWLWSVLVSRHWELITFPSLAENQHGRTTMRMHPWESGTGA
ncbi:PHD finger protein 7-like, partial [Phasianus colchicus]|uniref:PHD finger protein 7-like n=1 Tax=Phasianus colchicus TaxID=9054 RepID=UPI00129D8689